MRWYMPCRLGEWYPETKFLNWTNWESGTSGARVFGLTGRQLQLRRVDVGMDGSFSDEPEVFREYFSYTERDSLELETYNAGKWNFEKLILEVPDSEFEERVIGKKKVRLIGFGYDENGLLGHYITCDRYQHFYEPVNIDLVYREYNGHQYIHFEFEGGHNR